MGALPIPHPFPSSTLGKATRPLPCPSPRASSSNPPPHSEDSSSSPSPDPDFDSRITRVSRKYRSGTGKKAELRRARKGKGKGSSASVLLPPVPLREPKARGGVRVEVGFTPYSERLNGAAAALGLAALLLVELGSGKGLLSFHAPPIIFVQAYTVAAAAAVYIKWEKERISVWPEKKGAADEIPVGGE